MSTTPKISCVTITHNRVNMVLRSLECFQKQQYEHKELLIFFTSDDRETPQFARESNAYRHLLLKQVNPSKDLLIENLTDPYKKPEEFRHGDELVIKNKEGLFLHWLPNGDTKWVTQRRINRGTYTLIKKGKAIFLKTGTNTYLVYDESGGLAHTQTMRAENRIQLLLLADRSIKLLNPALHEQGTMEQLGFIIEELHPGNTNITLVELHEEEKLSLGAKRNLAVELTKGDYICIWDDDDWYDENRLPYQMATIQFTKQDACALANTILFDHHTNRGYVNSPRMDGWEQTLMCKKSTMEYYDNLNRKEDTPVLKKLYSKNQIAVIEAPDLYIYNIHTGRGNTSSASHFIDMVNNEQTIPLNADQNKVVIQKLGTV